VTTAGTLVSTAAGVALIGLVGRDAFDALFHAEGRGTFSRQITRAVWQVFRRVGTRHERLSLAGPVAFVTVIATWAGLLVLGWALVFWPHVPGSFRFDAGIDAGGPDFVHALNVSLVTLTTLGFGDITPTSDALRLILPLEALLGFGLLSASISWLVSIYPAGPTDPSRCGNRWCPHNASKSMTGVQTMWSGFGKSVNTFFVKLEQLIGAERAVRMAERLGLRWHTTVDRRQASAEHASGWGAFTLSVDAGGARGFLQRDTQRRLDQMSDDNLLAGASFSLGLAIGLFVSGSSRLLVALTLVPAAAMLSTLMTREREAAGSAEAGSRRRSAKSTTA